MDKKKRAMWAWELGGNLGHLYSSRAVASALEELGYDVVIAAKELHRAKLAYNNTPSTLLQAPVWLQQEKFPTREVDCITDILLDRGYKNPEDLFGLANRWRDLFQLIKPDIVFFDYAPTALIAGQFFSFKKIVAGSGFAEVPFGKPQLSRQMHLHDINSQPGSESTVVENINIINKKRGNKLISNFSEIYNCEETLITNIPELDPYNNNRANVTYMGPLTSISSTQKEIAWPTRYNKNIFVYLKPSNKFFNNVLRSLAQTKANIIMYINVGSTPKLKFPDNLIVSTEPVDLGILRKADLTIADGTVTLARSLLNATPILIPPSHLEQHKTAEIAFQFGASNTLKGGMSEYEIKSIITEMLTNPNYKQKAKEISFRHSDDMAKKHQILNELLSRL